jgi:nifR3 family TIM-barrel protein
MNFWRTLKKPILALAPMEDVTDAAFRRIIAQKGKPDVTFCEFTSADGLVLADEKGQNKLRRKLLFSEIERPVVAQFFTAIPEHMEQAACIAAEMGFDGVDINMGCPDRAVEKSQCGAAMIKNPPLAREIIRAAKRGAGKIPVSVKTRLGYNEDQLEEWLPELLAEDPAAITIHARTRKEMSAVPARWERIARAVEIRDRERGRTSLKTLILGNGDVVDCADARAKCEATGADGAMLGRAIFGNPWLFSDRTDEPSAQERIEALGEHITLFEQLMGDVRSFAVMKKHFKAYISGWDNAKDLRVRLMEAETAEEALGILSA